MKHSLAIEKSITALEEFAEDKELRAALTHWLQNPEKLPPLFNKYHKQIVISELIDGYSAPNKFKSKLSVAEDEEPYQLKLPIVWDDLPYPPPEKWNFTFIDLFAGIGGFRQAFQSVGGKCVFTSEWDKYAKKTYEANYGETPYGDIRKINKSDIPDHDVLCAGFPCQPFSLAGVSKKNSLGRKHGFEDETQGTLFFEIKEILRIKRPKAFILENVKNLLSHNKGETFEVIRHALEENLGYVINWKVVDGANWVPQHRERIFIVGYDPKQIKIEKEEIVIPIAPGAEYSYPTLPSIIHKKLAGYTLGPGTWDTLERHKANHAAKGNGFGYGIHRFPIADDTVTRTISARYHKDGAEILIAQKGDRPRRLSVEEAMQLQGYDPEHFVFPVSKTQAYKQIGNSVVVPAIRSAAKEIAKIFKERG
ncbi:DNA (cytosine-5-)-methyltransferase [Chitinivibrio alkaliphilus]|uniref:Cytosine-specific methyltransferase n=1 Tax=Chitinivibrio alkaliphilus ACht1 TaxID=1313304 RepID=U7D7Y5_9BACT|nr:DNA (cytosine-5-)-methyltransferase [Chitinivibrio alkaliphilus]ERP39065.1 DNA (cytosine-5-)-methyltransferase [Chitinivibrio alkaliphilus ACht1]